MPFVGGKSSSIFHVGAKTWRPKTADQQFLESQRKRLAEEEQLKKAEVQQRIKTLEQVRKLEEKTQALNEMALSAELRAKEHELAMRERQVAEAKQLELAKIDLAKRMGRESLSEADLARIRNERLRTEALARAAKDHAVLENHRPVQPVNLPPPRTPVPPPPPVPHPLPQPLRAPPTQPHGVHPVLPPRVPQAPIANTVGASRHSHAEAATRMRRMSESLAHPPAGFARPQGPIAGNAPRGLGAAPYPNRHSRQPSGTISAEMALRAQAERLRRRKLEALDLKARQHNLKVQALRDLRRRELVAELRERGIQQREIESQVAIQAERERSLNEAQLREIRDREHRIRLKEKGLQEREILDQLRRRQENDREALRRELELLERQMQRKELLEAELSIKRAMEKGESPPLGIARPTIEEIEREGLLNDLYDDLDATSPYLRPDVVSEFGLSVDYRPRTPSATQSLGIHSSSHAPNATRLSRAASIGSRTPHLPPISPAPSLMVAQAQERLREEQIRLRDEIQLRTDLLHAASSRAPTPRVKEGISRHSTPQPPVRDTLDNSRLGVGGRSTPFSATPRTKGEEHLGDNLARTPARSRSQSFDHPRPPSAALTDRAREESRGRARDSSRSRQESQPISRPLSRQEVASIARAESRAAIREDLEAVRAREKAQMKAQESQRLREELRAREENNRLASEFGHRMPTPSMSHQRTPSVRDGLEPRYYHDSHHLDVVSRPSSRASNRVHDYDSISRPVSRGAESLRSGYSPVQPRLGLPSRPSSRNLTVEDLGLQFGRQPADRIPAMNSAVHDELLAARLESAAVNSEINGGRRSRANSRADPMDHDYRHADFLVPEMNAISLNGVRSRAGSRSEVPDEDFLRSTRNQLGTEFGLSGPSGTRSRSNSQLGPYHAPYSPSNQRRDQLGAELAHTGGRHSRANSISQSEGLNATLHPTNDSRNSSSLIGLGRSPNSNVHANLYSPERGLGSFTNEELSQLSTEQLESMLNRQVDRSPMRLEGSSMGFRREEAGQVPPSHYDFPSRHAPIASASHLEVGTRPPHSIGRRGSHIGMDESPLFGDSAYPHSPIGVPRPLSRLEGSSSRPYGVPDYDGYPAAGGRYLDGRDEHSLGPEYPYDTDEGEFIITEMAEHPGARIIRRLGMVEASSNSPRSGSFGPRYDGINERQDMHRAVKQIITQATARGANAVVSLRVSDSDDGSYVASGEAVVLEEI